MGAGKAEEIKNFVKDYSVDEIQELIFDEHLTTRQIHNLEKLTELQVIDRERLILNIFSCKATTTESKLQIELAEINIPETVRVILSEKNLNHKFFLVIH